MKFYSVKTSLVYLFILLFILPALFFAQTTYYVSSTNGSDSNLGTSPAQSFVSLSKAVTVAVPNDMIVVYTGIYSEPTINISKNLNFQINTNPNTGGLIVDLPNGIAINFGTITLACQTPNQFFQFGGVVLNNGNLVLASNVRATRGTTLINGNLVLTDFNYTQLGVDGIDFLRTGSGQIMANNGFLILEASSTPVEVNSNAPLTISNLKINASISPVILLGQITIANQLIHQSGILEMGMNVLTFSGNSYNFISGMVSGAPTAGIKFTTTSTLTLNSDLMLPSLIIDSPGTITIVSNNSSIPRNINVTGSYIQTKGDLVIGNNNLRIDSPASFTRTAGSIIQGGGYLWLGTQNLTTLGTGFNINNLRIMPSGIDIGTASFLINSNLMLDGPLITSADGKLFCANNATITRNVEAGMLNRVPEFTGSINLKYLNTALLTTGKEVPAASTLKLNNFSVDLFGSNVMLGSDICVTGTLSLSSPLDPTPNFKVTMGINSTLELKSNGVLLQPVIKLGNLNLIYNGASIMTPVELGFPVQGVFPTHNGSITFKGKTNPAVVLPGNLSISNDLILDGGTVDLNGFTLGVGSLIMSSQGGNVINAQPANGVLDFIGTNNTVIQLPYNIMSNVDIRLNKTEGTLPTPSVTLIGGNINLAQNFRKLIFKNGILITGNNSVILNQSENVGTTNQGFDRAGVIGTNVSHIIGKVTKLIDIFLPNAAARLTRVEFPVGTFTNYRPLSFQFNPSTLPTANFNLSVSHVDANPGGTVGLPLVSGSTVLSNYPNFYWFVQSDLAVQSQVQYDIEALASGYNAGPNIQEIRFIKRFDSSDQNPWQIQTGTGYDNGVIGTSPIVIVRNAQGAITNLGNRFTFGETAKPPIVSTTAQNVSVNEGSLLTITWTAASQNPGGAAQFNSDLVWTAQAPAVVPTNYTFNSNTGVMEWTPTSSQAGLYTVKVKAVEGTLFTENTVNITVNNVNHAPVFAENGILADQSIKYGRKFAFSYSASDVDSDILSYSVQITPSPIGSFMISSSNGNFEFTPSFADYGKVFKVTVTVSDGIATATTFANLTIVQATFKGDVDLNGSGPNLMDAMKILNSLATLTTLTPEQSFYADVNSDGQVDAMDASWILEYIVNGVWPSGNTGNGNVAVTLPTYFGKSETEVILPVNVNSNSGNGIKAFSGILIYDKNIAIIKGAQTTGTLAEGGMLSVNADTINGILYIAYAKSSALAGPGILLNLNVRLKAIGSTTLEVRTGTFKFNAGIPTAVIQNGTITSSSIVWSNTLNITDNGSANKELKFGLATDATNGIDLSLGENTLPPVPPAGIIDARFQLPITPVEYSLYDYRKNGQEKIEWVVSFQPGSGGYPIKFSWDPSQFPQGSYMLTDMVTGEIVKVNMKSQNSYTLTNDAITKLKITFTKQLSSFIKLAADWNIFSVPVITESMKKTIIFPNATSPAYAYSNGYVSTEDLTVGKGYWIRYGSGTNLTVTGQQVNTNTIPVVNGWNIIGAYERDVKVTELTTTPANIISSPFYGYSLGYKIPDSLKIGKGYWVRVNSDGVINLPTGLAKNSEMNAFEVEIKADWTKIEISDLNNRSNTLYLSANSESDIYDLPPTPPTGIFDIRWSSDRIVENVNVTNEIRLNSLEYPVTIKLIGSDLRIKDKVNGRFINRVLKNGESLQITNSAVERLEITRVEIPTQFELYQNYPNPFNPATKIKFALPEKGIARLTVYNTLGEKVTDLINQELDAGYHEVEWNATTYGSGVYFVQLHANRSSIIKKVLLIK